MKLKPKKEKQKAFVSRDTDKKQREAEKAEDERHGWHDEETLLHHIQLIRERCWKGYKPAKGKKPYSKGSCVKEAKQPKFGAKFGTLEDLPPKTKRPEGVDGDFEPEPIDPKTDGFMRADAQERSGAETPSDKARLRAHGLNKKVKDRIYHDRVERRLASGKKLLAAKPPTRSGRPKGNNPAMRKAIENVYRPRDAAGNHKPLKRVEIPELPDTFKQSDHLFPGAPWSKKR